MAVIGLGLTLPGVAYVSCLLAEAFTAPAGPGNSAAHLARAPGPSASRPLGETTGYESEPQRWSPPPPSQVLTPVADSLPGRQGTRAETPGQRRSRDHDPERRWRESVGRPDAHPAGRVAPAHYLAEPPPSDWTTPQGGPAEDNYPPDRHSPQPGQQPGADARPRVLVPEPSDAGGPQSGAGSPADAGARTAGAARPAGPRRAAGDVAAQKRGTAPPLGSGTDPMGQASRMLPGEGGPSQTGWNPIHRLWDAFAPQQSPQGGLRVKIPLFGSLPPEAVQTDPETGLVRIAVRDAPLNEVLGTLAQQQGLNIIAAEDIKARVTIALSDVRFEQALTQILSVAGYTWVRQGNIILVTSVATGTRLAPYVQGRETRVFPLDYVSASDVDLVVKGLLSPVGQSFINQTTTSDARKTQEAVVVDDLPEYLHRVEQYILQVDRPPRQVLIEAHVLSVELTDDAKTGIDLKYLDLNKESFTIETTGFADPLASPAFFFNVAAPDLVALLEALETTTDAKALAHPKVLALNGQQARIQIGEQLGYRITTTTQTSTLESVDFLDVGVVLTVTPWITRENQVVMHVKPEVSSGQINATTELPEEETTEVETALMLPDGYGMVIGGLIQEVDMETQDKVPIVGDLWLIGRLFQHRKLKRKRTEIIIALVPHVVPYGPQRHARECEQFYRADTPLFHGPLRQTPRPDEPRFPDAGQRLPLRLKTQHLRALPDKGIWPIVGPQEACLPGMTPLMGGFPGQATVPEDSPETQPAPPQGEVIRTPPAESGPRQTGSNGL